MNKNQRIVLIAAGAIIAIFQLYGIATFGLDESRGWAVSFLIAAGLIFLGLGTWDVARLFKGRTDVDEKPLESANLRQPSKRAAPNAAPPKNSGKYAYGIHISEFDIAIETHKSFAQKTSIFHHLQGNGRSLDWNCCASVYASMRYAARKKAMRIHNVVWNTIVHAAVVRMCADEIDGVGIGSPGYDELEAEAYGDLKLIDQAVEAAIAGKGAYEFEPIVTTLAMMFGTGASEIKPLSAIIGMNATAAHEKILPELLADLS